MRVLYQWILIGFRLLIANGIWSLVIWASVEKLKKRTYSLEFLNMRFATDTDFKVMIATLCMPLSLITTFFVLTAYERGYALSKDSWFMFLTALGLSIFTGGIAIRHFMGELPTSRSIISLLLLVVAAWIARGGH